MPMAPGGWATALGQALLMGNQGYQQTRRQQAELKLEQDQAARQEAESALRRQQTSAELADRPAEQARGVLKAMLDLNGANAFNMPEFLDTARSAKVPIATQPGLINDTLRPAYGEDFVGPFQPQDRAEVASLLGIAPDTEAVIPPAIAQQQRQIQQRSAAEQQILAGPDGPLKQFYLYNQATGGDNLPSGFATQAAGAQRPAALASGVTGPDVLQGVDPGMANLVKKIADYDVALPNGTVLRTPYWQNVLELVAAYDPTFSQSEYANRQALKRDYTSGKSAANIRSLNTVVGHLKTLREAGKALNNGNFVLGNTVGNWLNSATGDPRVNNFNTAATAVEGELANVFKNSGATDQEIKSWRSSIDPGGSPDQMEGFFRTALGLFDSRLNAVGDQYRKGMGGKDFPIINPEAQAILDELRGTGGHASVTSAPAAPAGLDPNEPLTLSELKAAFPTNWEAAVAHFKSQGRTILNK